MYILEGDVTMTIGDETKTLAPGDVAVVNRGVEHELLLGERPRLHRGARAGSRSITFPTASATSCSGLTAARCTWSDRPRGRHASPLRLRRSRQREALRHGRRLERPVRARAAGDDVRRGRRRRAVGPDESQARAHARAPHGGRRTGRDGGGDDRRHRRVRARTAAGHQAGQLPQRTVRLDVRRPRARGGRLRVEALDRRRPGGEPAVRRHEPTRLSVQE